MGGKYRALNPGSQPTRAPDPADDVVVTGSQSREDEIRDTWANANIHNLDPAPAPAAAEDDVQVTGSRSREDEIRRTWANADVHALDDDPAQPPPVASSNGEIPGNANHFVAQIQAGGSEYGQMITTLHRAKFKDLLRVRRALAKPARELKRGDPAALHRVKEALRIVRARVRAEQRS